MPTPEFLAQQKPMGAKLGTKPPGASQQVWVSTLCWGDGYWTRVEDDERMRHYPGNLDTETAAVKFVRGE